MVRIELTTPCREKNGAYVVHSTASATLKALELSEIGYLVAQELNNGEQNFRRTGTCHGRTSNIQYSNGVFSGCWLVVGKDGTGFSAFERNNI